MKRMSFGLTIGQVRARTKTVTRRKRWPNLKQGDRLLAVEKAMGLAKGEKHVVLDEIEVVSVTNEPLLSITPWDLMQEGFPDMTAGKFITMYCRANGGTPDQTCNRIVFRYVKDDERQWDGWAS